MKLGNKQGFSLVLAMGIVILITSISFLILEYMIPFSKNVKGIENSSRAYYEANSGIEEAMFIQSQGGIGSESIEALDANPVDSSHNLTAMGDILPPPGEGNSEFDTNREWNRISEGEPIQLFLDKPIANWSGITITFRVPDFDRDGNPSNQDLDPTVIEPIINWQLSSYIDALNASDYVLVGDINSETLFNIGTLEGIKLDGTPSISIDNFYNDGANNCTTNGCTLKFSVINKLELDNGTPVPYLEWQMNFNGTLIPLRFARINSSGKSYGFKKDLEVSVPQQTVNEAFDFTIFQ